MRRYRIDGLRAAKLLANGDVVRCVFDNNLKPAYAEMENQDLRTDPALVSSAIGVLMTKR